MADTEEDSEEVRTTDSSLQDLTARIETLEDKVMMERLEDLSLEDEIEVVEDLLGREEQEIEQKLEMLDRIEQEYQETQVEEKLQYLYQEIKKLQKSQGEGGSESGVADEVSELRDKVVELENRLDNTQPGSEDQNFDDVYDKLYTLRDRIKTLKEEGVESGGGDLSDADREEIISEVESRIDTGGASAAEIKEKVLAEIGPEDISEQALETLRNQITALEEQVETYREEGGEPSDAIKSRVSDVEQKVGEGVSGKDVDVEGWEAEFSELRDKVSELEEHLPNAELLESIEYVENELSGEISDLEGQSTGGEVEIDTIALLEALEYEGEELEDRFKEILVRIEQLREEIAQQGERMDSLSHAQNIFESNIGAVMQEQREFTEKLEQEDRKLDRKTDLLLESLEKGLEMEEEEFREMMEKRLEGVGEELDVSGQELDRARISLDERLGEEAEEGVKALAEVAAENQRRVRKLQEKLEDMEKHSPTIVE